ncbi:OprD family outer membrane porin [Orbus mooreae]|uniref:OprD family outer membrane porin n=1 Tax=Orbus mooreae TaxID=3074107 RepID=UPI00370D5183
MKKQKITLLGLIIISLSAYATENTHYELLDTLAAGPFFKDTKIDLSARNYWKYLKENESNPKEVHNAWGQAFGINYKSGYFLDFIGFDATFTGVIKLGASDYFSPEGYSIMMVLVLTKITLKDLRKLDNVMSKLNWVTIA